MENNAQEPKRRTPRRALTALLLCLAALAFFVPHLDDSFFADDHLHIAKNRDLPLRDCFRSYGFTSEDIEYLWWIDEEVLIRYFRPLVTLTIMLDYRLGGLDGFPYHLSNLLFHLIAGVLVLALAREVTGREDVSVASALVFLFHPVHAEALFWVSGRVDTIVTALILGAVLLHIQGAIRSSRARSAAGTACFVAALMAKETALVVPVLVVAFDLYSREPGRPVRQMLRARLGVYVPLAIISAGFLIAHRLALGSTVGLNPPYYYTPASQGFIPQALAKILVYLLHFVFYIPLMPVSMTSYFKLLGTFVAVLSVILVPIAWFVYRTVREERPIRYFLFWALITLAMITPIMPGERLLYLPSVGLCLVMGTFAADLWRANRSRRRARLLTLSLFVLIFSSYLFSLRFAALVYQGLSASMEEVVGQVREEVPEVGPGKDFYFIELNMWPVANIAQSLQLAYDSPRIRASALTVSPDPTIGEEAGRTMRKFAEAGKEVAFPHGDVPSGPYWRREGERSLRIGLEKGAYFASPLTELILYGRPPFALGEVIRKDRFKATVTRMDELGPAEFLFEFNRPLADPGQVFFLCEGLRLHRLDFSEEEL